MTTPIAETLAQRGQVHGNFIVGSVIMRDLMDRMQSAPNWTKLHAAKQMALLEIAHKMSRILVGDPNHVDHWQDIAGYATLAIDDGGACP